MTLALYFTEICSGLFYYCKEVLEKPELLTVLVSIFVTGGLDD